MAERSPARAAEIKSRKADRARPFRHASFARVYNRPALFNSARFCGVLIRGIRIANTYFLAKFVRRLPFLPRSRFAEFFTVLFLPGPLVIFRASLPARATARHMYHEATVR